MNKNNKSESHFSLSLLHWHKNENNRQFPWKESQDPYKIWISEILLQQTRADHGIPYYLKFVEKYPDIEMLAKAPDEEVFRLWQGLGYYSRCQNLLATARYIYSELGGKFPNNYKDILALKGVGPYTAAAISSFAFNLPYAVVDGNVYRVLSRHFGSFLPIDTTEGKKYFQELAQQLLPVDEAAIYNQAIMDFGSLICKPQSPLCSQCPVQNSCFAFNNNVISELPVKSKKIQMKNRYFHYLLLRYQDTIYIHQRRQKDVWQHLFELFLIETSEDIRQNKTWITLQAAAVEVKYHTLEYQQRLTHQHLFSQLHEFTFHQIPDFLKEGKWLKVSELNQYTFPKTILFFLTEKQIL